MDIQLIIEIAVVAIIVLLFVFWLVWQIKKKGLKQFVTQMIVKAEDTYDKGQNSEKLNFVIDKVIAMLPKPLQFFITRETVKKFVQSIFDTVKKALDYTPKKES